MLDEKTFICIRCPRGCEIKASYIKNNIEKIEGNGCKLGIEYVKTELSDPRRIVTSTVKVKNGKYPLIPVWTSEAIPKDKIFKLMKLLKDIELNAPVKAGTVILKNACNTGADVLTSRSIK